MPTFGGFMPYPRKFGGGIPRPKIILEGLQTDNGTAYTTDTDSIVYVEDLATARAISAAWGTNNRLGALWAPQSMSEDILTRWEQILKLAPAPTDTEGARRERLLGVLSGFGLPVTGGRMAQVLDDAIGDAFVAIENIDYAHAAITVPDGSYPWGSVVSGFPWSSTVCHVLVRLQRTSSMTELEFYKAAAKVSELLEPILPAWATVDWYRAGPISTVVSGGPSAAGFYLDDDHNLDNEVFDS